MNINLSTSLQNTNISYRAYNLLKFVGCKQISDAYVIFFDENNKPRSSKDIKKICRNQYMRHIKLGKITLYEIQFLLSSAWLSDNLMPTLQELAIDALNLDEQKNNLLKSCGIDTIGRLFESILFEYDWKQELCFDFAVYRDARLVYSETVFDQEFLELKNMVVEKYFTEDMKKIHQLYIADCRK